MSAPGQRPRLESVTAIPQPDVPLDHKKFPGEMPQG